MKQEHIGKINLEQLEALDHYRRKIAPMLKREELECLSVVQALKIYELTNANEWLIRQSQNVVKAQMSELF